MGDGRLVLQGQDVAGPAGHPLQLDAGIEQHRVGAGQRGRVVVEHEALGGLGPVEGVDVPQPAPALLEVGLQPERHLARFGVAFVDACPQLGQPPLGLLLTLAEGGGGQPLRDRWVAGDDPGAEQSGGGVEVVAGQVERLADGAHAVAQVEALVPDRVPDAVGQSGHVAPAIVDEHEVDVALGTQLRPPVTADRDQRGALVRSASIAVVPETIDDAADPFAATLLEGQPKLAAPNAGLPDAYKRRSNGWVDGRPRQFILQKHFLNDRETTPSYRGPHAE